MPPPLARSDHLFHMRNVTYRRAATGFSKFNRNYFMPLTPSTNAQVISDMGTFIFPMIDGETVVPASLSSSTRPEPTPKWFDSGAAAPRDGGSWAKRLGDIGRPRLLSPVCGARS